MKLLPVLLSLASISFILGGENTADALAFTPQLENIQFPNLFNAFAPPKSQKSTFTYTHLECNGQLWQASTPNNNNQVVSIVIDPLASQLDFGIPWGYRANKKVLSESATIEIIKNASPSHCLLTMGLDDHTHLPTLNLLKEECPDLEYIVAPSCEKKLLDAGFHAEKITVLKHGQSCDTSFGKVTATMGALVGPPWQTRENGFLVEIPNNNSNNNNKNDDCTKDDSTLSIYYEPHADVILPNLIENKIRAKVMISPITKQSLPAQVPPAGQYTLVYGGERTLEIANAIGAEVIVPLGNGALDVDGPLASLVKASGDVGDFERLVEERNLGEMGSVDGEGVRIRVEKSVPGSPLSFTI